MLFIPSLLKLKSVYALPPFPTQWIKQRIDINNVAIVAFQAVILPDHLGFSGRPNYIERLQLYLYHFYVSLTNGMSPLNCSR